MDRIVGLVEMDFWMSISKISAVFGSRRKAILGSCHTKNARLLLIALADNAGDDGYGWPSLDELSFKTGLDRRSIMRLIPDLEKSGEIYVRHGGGRAKSNEYIIALGLSEQDLANSLMRYFDYPPDKAQATARTVSARLEKREFPDLLLDLANGNGDKMSPYSDGNGDKMSPYSDGNGDKMSPYSDGNGDSLSINGDSLSINGDRESPEPSITINKPLEKNIIIDSAISFWPKLQKHISHQMTRASYDRLIAQASYDWRDGVHVIVAPTASACEWLEHRARPIIERAFEALGLEGDIAFDYQKGRPHENL